MAVAPGMGAGAVPWGESHSPLMLEVARRSPRTPQSVVRAAEIPEETIQRAVERLCGERRWDKEAGKENVDLLHVPAQGTPGKGWESGSHLRHHLQGLASHPALQGVPSGSSQPQQQVIRGGDVSPESLLAILGSIPR